MPNPQFMLNVTKIFRYEQEIDTKLQEFFELLDKQTKSNLQQRIREDQIQIRKDYILNIKK